MIFHQFSRLSCLNWAPDIGHAVVVRPETFVVFRAEPTALICAIKKAWWSALLLEGGLKSWTLIGGFGVFVWLCVIVNNYNVILARYSYNTTRIPTIWQLEYPTQSFLWIPAILPPQLQKTITLLHTHPFHLFHPQLLTKPPTRLDVEFI